MSTSAEGCIDWSAVYAGNCAVQHVIDYCQPFNFQQHMLTLLHGLSRAPSLPLPNIFTLCELRLHSSSTPGHSLDKLPKDALHYFTLSLACEMAVCITNLG